MSIFGGQSRYLEPILNTQLTQSHEFERTYGHRQTEAQTRAHYQKLICAEELAVGATNTHTQTYSWTK